MRTSRWIRAQATAISRAQDPAATIAGALMVARVTRPRNTIAPLLVAPEGFRSGVVLKPRLGNQLPNRATRTISAPIVGVTVATAPQ
jgi:hypothetical protein